MSSGPPGQSDGSLTGQGFVQDRAARLEKSQHARDIFPLPSPPKVIQEGRLSRRSQQRLCRKRRLMEDVGETVSALNWLNGYRLDNEFSGPPDDMQEQVLKRVMHVTMQSWEKGKLPSIPKEEAALTELLRGRSEYEGSNLPVTLARFDLERISIPEDLSSAPCVEDLLPEEARQYLESPELMVRDEPPEDLIKPYWDPALKSSRKNYRCLMQRLHKIGYLRYTFKPLARAGMFFVHKSDRKKIRLIVDARPANQLFHSPPSVQLCTSEGFARIEIEVPSHILPGTDEFRHHLRDRGLHFGLADVKDCFHRMRQPAWLSRYFWDPIPARWIEGLVGTKVDGRVVTSQCEVFPMPASLCMGFSWSLYFAQLANENLMRKVPRLLKSEVVSDRGMPMVFKADGGDMVRHYVYVDNLGIISPHEAIVGEALEQLSPCFDERGLILHPGELQHEDIRALGCSMRGDIMATRITPERFIRLRQAVGALMRRRKISGRILEVVLGHITFCCLCNRQLLCIFNTIYKFIRKHYYSPVRLWDSVRDELWAFRSLMVFLHSDWWRPWNSLVSASDASLGGYGVSTSFWDPLEVADCGRRLERTRFRKAASTKAREHALTSAGFIRDELTEGWRRKEVEDEELLDASGWEVVDDFVEVPSKHLAKPLWEPKLWGKWDFEAGILELEGRALVKSLRRVALSIFGSDIRQLLLVDNLTVALSFDRFRSRSYPLLKQIRRFASYLLARNISATVRWIPSELNNSDEPSRIFSQESSKLLTDQIPYVGCKEGTKPKATVGQKEEHNKQSIKPGPTEVRAQGQGKEECFGEENSERRPLYPATQSAGEVRPDGRRPLESSPKSIREKATVPFGELNQRCDLRGRTRQQRTEEEEGQTLSSDGRCCHGEFGPVPLGEERSWSENPQDVSGRAERVQGICSAKRLRLGRCYHRRQADSGIPQQALLGGFPGQSGRSADCCLAPFPAEVWKTWSGESSPHMAGVEGVSQTYPRQEPLGLSPDGLGSYGSATTTDGKTQDGAVRPRVRLQLCKAIGAHQTSSLQSCSTISRDHQVMVPFDEPGRETPSVKDRRIRQQCQPRQSMAHPLGPHVVRVPQTESSIQPVVGLRLQPVVHRVQEGCNCLGSGADTLPSQTLRSFDRSGPQLPVPVGGSEKRTVEVPEQRTEVRKVSKVGGNSREFVSGTPKPLQTLRGKPWGYHVGVPNRSRVRKKHIVGQYVMDLFAGKGGVSLACEKLGYTSKQWDIIHGPLHDLTDPKVVQRLLRDIRKGRVLAVMMAPICTSFSRARDRTKVIRNVRFPWGIPRRFLSEKERLSVSVGNKCFHTCIRLIEELNALQIPWILENPWSSRCWNLPPIRRLLQTSEAFLYRGDFCQWGARWKKPTGFMCNHVLDVHRLQRPCSGRNGFCSRSGRRHFLLTGTGPGGQTWTQIAQPYPSHLNMDLAHVLTSKYHATSVF